MDISRRHLQERERQECVEALLAKDCRTPEQRYLERQECDEALRNIDHTPDGYCAPTPRNQRRLLAKQLKKAKRK